MAYKIEAIIDGIWKEGTWDSQKSQNISLLIMYALVVGMNTVKPTASRSTQTTKYARGAVRAVLKEVREC